MKRVLGNGNFSYVNFSARIGQNTDVYDKILLLNTCKCLIFLL